MLKSTTDLERLREKARASLAAREAPGGARLVVAMGTCGIAAGAREVVLALMDELDRRDLHDIVVTQSGCKGLCDREPTVDVLRPGEPPVTYGDVTPADARRIISDHVLQGKVLKDLLLFVGEAEGPRA
jgi:NADP-reducing hydrogenase subunit HndB